MFTVLLGRLRPLSLIKTNLYV